MQNLKKPPKRIFIAYLTLPIVVYCLVVLFPIFGAVYYSFFNWSGGPKMTFSGADNYVKMVTDPTFWKSFGNNILLTALCVFGQIGLALVLALIVNSRYIKIKHFHLSVSYFPVILSSIVVGYIWSMLYDYNYGLFNNILKLIGLGKAVRPWLADNKLALILVSLPLIWKNIGYFMIIILAGLSSIDTSILEMAEIDGASPLQRLCFITMPMLRATMVVCLTLCISGNMKVFDHIYVMTNGGPGTATMVMALYAYINSFIRYKMGYGSALSIGILALSIAVTLIIRKITSGRNEEQL
jgi:raffinose/stachyose/melibiose transport system permease protein